MCHPLSLLQIKNRGKRNCFGHGDLFHGQGHGDGCDCFLEIHFWSVLHLMRGRLAQKLAEIYLGCYIESIYCPKYKKMLQSEVYPLPLCAFLTKHVILYSYCYASSLVPSTMIIDHPIERSFLTKTLTLRQREVQASTEKYKPLI